MEPKHWSIFSSGDALFVASPVTQADPPKTVQALRPLIISISFIACIFLFGCGQNDSYSSSADSISLAPTKPLVATSVPAVESERITHTETPGPTGTNTPISVPEPTQLPHISSTPLPTYTPVASHAIISPTVIVTTPTVIPPTAIVPTPAIIAVTTTAPTPTVMPTPTRPKVSGYLLKINGSYVRPNQVSIAIDNGYVMIHPMTSKDGSYSTRTEVTLGYYPSNAAGVVSWSGVDTDKGHIAEVFMNKDREITATISP